jgi:hypothetical protein
MESSVFWLDCSIFDCFLTVWLLWNIYLILINHLINHLFHNWRELHMVSFNVMSLAPSPPPAQSGWIHLWNGNIWDMDFILDRPLDWWPTELICCFPWSPTHGRVWHISLSRQRFRSPHRSTWSLKCLSCEPQVTLSLWYIDGTGNGN